MRSMFLAIVAFVVVGCNSRIVGPDPLPPVINSFTADATRLASPLLDTFLRWSVTGDSGTHCRIESPGQASQSIGDVPLGGFVQIRPQVSRDYTLTCSNTGGTVIRIVSIIVG